MSTEVHKLDIAFEHIQTAVLLSAVNWSARSLHLQVMAADELISSVAKAKNVELAIDMDAMIAPGYESFWRRSKRKSYNYFKHADRDAHDTYEGPNVGDLQAFNDLMMMQAITNLRSMGYQSTALDFFHKGLMLLYPQVIAWDRYKQDHPEMWELAGQLVGNIDRAEVGRAVVAQYIAEGRLDSSDLTTAVQFSPNLR